MGDKIPPSLPLPKGGIPLFAKEGLSKGEERNWYYPSAA